MQDDEKLEGQERATPDVPESPSSRHLFNYVVVAGAAIAIVRPAVAAGTGSKSRGVASGTTGYETPQDTALSSRDQNVVLIYLENRSFNNLFADFAGREPPLSSLAKQHYAQRDRNGSVLEKLPSIWQGLVPYKRWIDGKTWCISEGAMVDLPNAHRKLYALGGTAAFPCAYPGTGGIR